MSLPSSASSPASPGIDFPGVGCGLAILRDNQILLCRRLKAPERGHWTITGGKVDLMEDSRTAARREGVEESGLIIGPAIDFLCVSEQVLEQDRQHWISLIYVTHDTTGDPQETEPGKLADIGWFDLDALPTPLSRFAADAISAIRAR
ncbi:DNA mismatch repair protein MutT [Rhizobium sp. Leaf384]|uniref:NUDIX domain-containing protein n=1 Tax=unclassified Rhizobium TaxID=2613769 RepID=UPI000715F4D3|nr:MULTISPECIES: NUDIX domain-containing protein [unclassified Rhizobium]KQS79138.1 DNA mismatch repair protein MutT [Rhizobium sp. Leaf384]KQS82706.1 DNA mismatch repair protein MutT [Rhizobium sp. Leaf383]